MIYDIWENRHLYTGVHSGFAAGFAYLEKCLQEMPAPGVYEIDGKNLFSKVQSFTTRQEGFYETHDHYIDIQYMAQGKELVYIAQRRDLTPKGEYDPVEDAQFYTDDDLGSRFVFEEGSFAIFFPDDAHKPSMVLGEPAKAGKIVLKVKCDLECGDKGKEA